jgi:hypothetical protein
VNTVIGELLHEGIHQPISHKMVAVIRVNVFSMMLQTSQFNKEFHDTSYIMARKNPTERPFNRQNLTKNLGVKVLQTRNEFASRDGRWNTDPTSKYGQRARFGEHFSQSHFNDVTLLL